MSTSPSSPRSVSMQRRHFELIARVIAESGEPYEVKLWWARRFALALRITNPQFTADRFIRAATGADPDDTPRAAG